MEKILTVSGVSKRIGMTQNQIIKYCEEYPELIPKFFILHGLHRWKESDVEDWIRQNKDDNL